MAWLHTSHQAPLGNVPVSMATTTTTRDKMARVDHGLAMPCSGLARPFSGLADAVRPVSSWLWVRRTCGGFCLDSSMTCSWTQRSSLADK